MCGIVGIVDAGGASFPLYYALYALQHRGQESAGISTFDGHLLYKQKGQGLVSEIFNEEILRSLTGTTGIGHVRYPTTGSKIPENIQPFNFTFRGQKVAIAHNGNLVNAQCLREEFEERGQIFCTTSDTEVIGNIIADEFRKSEDVLEAVQICMQKLKGSYSVVMMVDNEIWAFRDPLGIRPLCLGKTDHGHVVCSESVAVDALAGTFLRDVRPGELVRLTSGFSGLDLLWASSLELSNKSSSVKALKLLSSSDQAFALNENITANPYEVNGLASNENKERSTLDLGYVLSGKFKSFYTDKESPENRMIVIGDSDFASDVIRYSDSPFNIIFLENAVEWLAIDDSLLTIKTRDKREMRLNKIQVPEKKVKAILFVYLINIILVPAAVIAFGIIRFIRRKRKES